MTTRLEMWLGWNMSLCRRRVTAVLAERVYSRNIQTYQIQIRTLAHREQNLGQPSRRGRGKQWSWLNLGAKSNHLRTRASCDRSWIAFVFASGAHCFHTSLEQHYVHWYKAKNSTAVQRVTCKFVKQVGNKIRGLGWASYRHNEHEHEHSQLRG